MSTINGSDLRRTATVQIFTGDYLDRLRHLEAQHDAAIAEEKKTPQLNGEILESERIRTEHQELKAEAERTSINVIVRALRRGQWRELVAEHPPRADHADDAKVGVNEDTFKDALVAKSVVSGITDDQLEDLSDVDFDRIYFTAFALNRAPAASPKALDLPESPTNDATLN